MKRKLLYLFVALAMVMGFLPGSVPALATLAAMSALATPAATTPPPPELQWQKTSGGANNDNGYSVQQTADGGYIIVGSTNSSGASSYDVYLIKTDASGNMTWQKTFGGANWDEGYSVKPTADGGYIIVGKTVSFGAGAEDVSIIKTNASGNMTWSRTLGGAGHDIGQSVHLTPDGGYIITGVTTSIGAGETDVYLIKTDASGNMTWSQTFGGVNSDEGQSIQQTTDGGYIVAGSTQSFGAGGMDVYLIKVAAPATAPTIQALVDAASPGDTIIVGDGTYIENVNVNRPLTIQSVNGASSTIVQAANPADHVFEITADNVTLTGFTVTGAVGNYYAGIYLGNVANSTISHNIISNNVRGIWLQQSHTNTISNNTINSNSPSGQGIQMVESNGNTIANNTVHSNTDYGGIHVFNSHQNMVVGNTADGDSTGNIWLEYGSTNNTIMGNSISGNNFQGIFLFSNVRNNAILKNNIFNNGQGFRIYSADNNTIYLNNLNNWTNVFAETDSPNRWESPIAIPYTYNGTAYETYLGNSWSSYGPSGYGGIDSDNNGIGDSPYVIREITNVDHFPLMATFENYETVSAQPDLIISEKHEEWIVPGVSYRVFFTVKNIGNATTLSSGNSTFEIGLNVNGVSIEQVSVPNSLAPGDNWTSSFSENITPSGSLPRMFDKVGVQVDANNEIDESEEGNNWRWNIFSWPPKPNLVVYKWEEWLVQGQTYIVHYKVTNNGNAPAPAGHDTRLKIDGTIIETQAVPVILNSGQSYSDVFSYTANLTGGVDSITVTTDSFNEVDESFEGDNTIVNTLAGPAKPDLVIGWKNEQWVQGQEGTQYIVSYSVQNIGNAVALAGHVVQLNIDGIVTENRTIPVDLSPNQEYTESFATVNISGSSANITVIADANNVVIESIETNNSLTSTWPVNILLPLDGVPVRINAPARVAPDRDFAAFVEISPVQSFDAANFDVSFNPAVLRLDNVTDGRIGSADNFTEIPVDVWNEREPRRFTIIVNIPGLTGATGSGYLAVLHFHVIGSLGQSSNINLSNGVLSSTEATEIPATWLGDFVEVALIGDVNGDGLVNAVDITKVERIIAGLDSPTPGADANQDGLINAVDITKVERLIARLD